MEAHTSGNFYNSSKKFSVKANAVMTTSGTCLYSNEGSGYAKDIDGFAWARADLTEGSAWAVLRLNW